MLKIVSWNVNGIRSIIGQNPSRKLDVIEKDNKLKSYIERNSPDIIFLQETKAEAEQIKPEYGAFDGYKSYFHSCERKKGYSGVALYTKIEPREVKYKIGIEKFDNEGRVIQADFEDFTVLGVYFPNGNLDNEGRLEYKLEFYEALFDYCEKLKAEGKKIIVCGDYNTAHYPIDLARPKENENVSGFLEIERNKFDYILSKGYIDIFRKLHPETVVYSWWSQRQMARPRNIGWRIDYHLISPDLLDKVHDCYYQTEEMGSDHCPMVLEIN